MADAEEIELKLTCEPFDQDKILAAAPPGEDEARAMTSVYFDTADGALARAGVSLRIRQAGGLRVQTLKRGGGLAREEHEKVATGEAPDPRWKPLKAALPKGARLEPVFEVQVTRRQRLVRHGGAQIELALDLGEVVAGPRRAAVSEVELELKSGEPAALFELALELAAAAPLYLSFEGKADKGHGLLADPPSQKTETTRLDRDASAGEVFQMMAREQLRQIAGHAAQMREAPTAEAVHQVRVAARRLRSALTTFAPLFEAGDAARFKAELKWLAGAFDGARNLQVYADDALSPVRTADPDSRGLTALAQAVEGARLEAQVRAAQAVSVERFRRLTIEALGWVEAGDWRDGDKVGKRARDFAAGRLDKRLKRLEKALGDLETLDDAARHEARIEAKKLRYAAEAFADLYPVKTTRPYIRALKALQDNLGRLNDLATADPLMAGLELDADAAFAAGELAGAALAGKAKLVAKAAKARARLAASAPFWRG